MDLKTKQECGQLMKEGRYLFTRNRDGSDELNPDYMTHILLWQDAFWAVKERIEDDDDMYANRLSAKDVADEIAQLKEWLEDTTGLPGIV
jgi:hypothetical protein